MVHSSSGTLYGQDNLLAKGGRESADSIRIESLIKKAFDQAPSNSEKALEYARTSLFLADSLDNRYLEAKAYSRLGVIYYYYSGYDRALDYNLKALEINEEIGYDPGIARDLNNIGLVYAQIQSYDNALNYYRRSLAIHEELEDQKGIANNYNNMGIVNRYKHKHDSALFFYQHALELNMQIGDARSLAHNHNNIGNLLQDQGNFSQARISYKRALKINRELGNKTELARNYFNLADIASRSGQFQKAERLLDSGIQQNKAIQSNELTADYLDSKIQLAEAWGKLELLPSLYDQYLEINDTLYSSEMEQELQNLHVLYDVAQKEDKIKLLEAETQAQAAKLENQRIFRTSLILISILLLVILVLMINRYRLKSNINKRLEKQVEQRTAALAQAKKRAEESDRLKSSFLANISHEIRTPMNAIYGFTSLLTDPNSYITQGEKEEMKNHIDENTQLLMRLIDDVIELAKIQEKQIDIYRENCYVYDITRSVYRSFQNISRDRPIDFILDVKSEDKRQTLYTDPHRLRQVLHNLTDNALKFTEKGSVTLGYRFHTNKGNSCITFYIKDTGLGISQAQQDIIFKRFGKIEENRKKLFRGAGLGLTLSKQITELMQGRLWLESELNKGSTFYFSLPC